MYYFTYFGVFLAQHTVTHDKDKGHALAEKAGAQMDFGYVPGHLGEF